MVLSWADYGRIGGLQTVLRHGREHMAEIGRRGGLAGRLPTIAEIRQQKVAQAQIQLKGGRLPNRLSELKALWKQKRGSRVLQIALPKEVKKEVRINKRPPGGTGPKEGKKERARMLEEPHRGERARNSEKTMDKERARTGEKPSQ